MNYHHNGAHASESSRAFDDEDDVRAYAHKRVDELISAQYADVDALPSEQRTTIIVDCAQELADVILEKIESGEPTDILTLGTSLIRGFLGERGFKASASAESLRRKPKGGEDQKERENKRLPNEARVRFSLTEKPKAPTFLLRDQYILGQATGLVARTKTGKTTALVEDALRLVTGSPGYRRAPPRHRYIMRRQAARARKSVARDIHRRRPTRPDQTNVSRRMQTLARE